MPMRLSRQSLRRIRQCLAPGAIIVGLVLLLPANAWAIGGIGGSSAGSTGGIGGATGSMGGIGGATGSMGGIGGTTGGIGTGSASGLGLGGMGTGIGTGLSGTGIGTGIGTTGSAMGTAGPSSIGTFSSTPGAGTFIGTGSMTGMNGTGPGSIGAGAGVSSGIGGVGMPSTNTTGQSSLFNQGATLGSGLNLGTPIGSAGTGTGTRGGTGGTGQAGAAGTGGAGATGGPAALGNPYRAGYGGSEVGLGATGAGGETAAGTQGSMGGAMGTGVGSTYAADGGGSGTAGGPTDQMDQFARDQERPALGIRVGQDPQGRVLISEVRPDSAASQAGLQVGDEIVRIGDTPIRSSDQVANLVRQARIGTPFKIEVRRDGQTVNAIGRLGIFASYFGPSDLMQGSTRPALGIRVRPNPQGQLEVTEVEPNSPAESVGLRPGDLIVSADGQQVGKFNQLVTALDRAKIGNPIDLEIRRNGQTMNVRPTVTSYAAMFAPTPPGGVERRAARQPLEEPNLQGQSQPGSPGKTNQGTTPGKKR